MNWTDTLKLAIEDNYRAAELLMSMVDEEHLSWKPENGENWWTTAQLLNHITESCGKCIKGFVTGDWGFPEGSAPPENMKPEEMLPPAEAMAAVKSVADARRMLAEDKQLALDMLAQAGEGDLSQKMVTAPWLPEPRLLGFQCLDMVGHLASHKSQLFYYLKLQGKSVNTFHLYGMGAPA